MKFPPDLSLYYPPLVQGVGAILIAGIAVVCVVLVAGSLGSAGAAEMPPAAEQPLAQASGTRDHRCADCGRVESVLEIEAPAGDRPGSYAITVRLRDGSAQVIADAHPAKWRRGERVGIIAGMGR